MQGSTFRYYQLKVAAKRLPGRGFRLDPIAVVYTGAGGEGAQWNEVGRTEKRLNEWNPKFAQSIALPGDHDGERKATLRVDFYNKQVEASRYLGMCETTLDTLIASEGREVQFELVLPSDDKPKGKNGPKVCLAAIEGYKTDSEAGNVSIGLQLAQTNHYGVSMTIYYEISRASNQTWFPVHKSEHVMIDEQGWGQFPQAVMPVRELTADEPSSALLFSIYRYRKLGTKKLLGRFQTSLSEVTRMREGEFLSFSGNAKEDLMSANVQITHARKVGTEYNIGLKLVNVVWRAPLIPPPKN